MKNESMQDATSKKLENKPILCNGKQHTNVMFSLAGYRDGKALSKYIEHYGDPTSKFNLRTMEGEVTSIA